MGCTQGIKNHDKKSFDHLLQLFALGRFNVSTMNFFIGSIFYTFYKTQE
jgi:hypothetical protein